MTNEEKAREYINYINDHYDELKKRFRAFCYDKQYKFDADIFQDTIIKCYSLIEKKGLEDDSPKGIENYTFKAFKQNLQREQQYSRNQKRDTNVTDIASAYEEHLNNQITAEEKLKSDIWRDFSLLYIMQKVEQHFDDEHFYLFRLKTFDKTMTYKKLQQKSGIPSSRQKCVNVKNWLKNNVTKEEVKTAFDAMYGNLL